MDLAFSNGFIVAVIITEWVECRNLAVSEQLRHWQFWLAAWLCILYCIKIVNSTHSLFLWCKLRISGFLWDLISLSPAFPTHTGSGCPFLAAFLCSIMAVASRFRHFCKMRGKGLNFQSPQMVAHIKAAGKVLSLLMLSLFA
ncbi:taste receptor type 2 member 41-like [Podarcis muralis]